MITNMITNMPVHEIYTVLFLNQKIMTDQIYCKAMDPVLFLNNVSFIRDGSIILHEISLCIRPGEHWAIIGQNGSGKTSLISIINGYHRPSEGKAEVLGRRFGSADLRELRKHIGECSSEIKDMIHEWESVREIVLSGRFGSIGLYERPSPEHQERADELLEFFGLSQIQDRSFRTLSSGEQQKTVIARSLMPEPELLVLDEPCAGLDPKAREELLGALQNLCSMNGCPTLIYITHHIEEIIPAVTHALALRKGEVIAKGTRKDVLTGEVLSRTFDMGMDVLERDGRLWPVVLRNP